MLLGGSMFVYCVLRYMMTAEELWIIVSPIYVPFQEGSR